MHTRVSGRSYFIEAEWLEPRNVSLLTQHNDHGPIEKDVIFGPIPSEILARVSAQTGEADGTIAALQKPLSIPYADALSSGLPLTPALLRLDLKFDPLRNELRFRNS